MGIKIQQFKNNPIDSNCYVIYKEDFRNCVLIDPGCESCDDLIMFLKSLNKEPSHILLTHEHFDHIWGVTKLKESYDTRVVCSKICSDSIRNKKKNLSLFYDNIGFELNSADILVEDYDVIKLNEFEFKIYSTPGHTEGSICIALEHILFTGDTLINNEKTVTKLPGGSKDKLYRSLELITNMFDDNCMIYPGHGDIVELIDLNNIN